MVLRNERTGIEKKFYELSLDVVSKLGLELYDLDYIQGSSTLRLFIMNPETQTALIEECAQVDRELSPFIEEEDWVPETLTLEVSSPGLYRNLNQIKHFETAVGEDIQLTLKKKLEVDSLPKKVKASKKVVAKLVDVQPEHIEVEIDKDLKLKFNYEDIAKANLETQI